MGGEKRISEGAGARKEARDEHREGRTRRLWTFQRVQ